MKQTTILILCFSALFLGGCGSSEDGPSLSDEELLKRGSAGRATGGGPGPKQAPAGAPMAPNQTGGR